MKKLHIFHHTDLDGMGVKILGIMYAQVNHLEYVTHCCGYSRINKSVRDCLNSGEASEIIIGDISVNDETAQLLNKAYNTGLKIKLYDHHEPAKFLNQYKWATVATNLNGTPCCGTKLLSEDPELAVFKTAVKPFVDTVNDWDTWTWKQNGNNRAKQLNSLFTILGEQEFTQYIMDLFCYSDSSEFKVVTSSAELFTVKTEIMVETHQRIVTHQTRSAEMYMATMNLWVQIPVESGGRSKYVTHCFKTGIVFLSDNLSEIGDNLLTEHPELDLLMIIALPSNISWRTHKDLPIPLGKIAELATGTGGGHAKAAASRVSFSRFTDAFCNFMDCNFNKQLDYSNIESSQWREG